MAPTLGASAPCVAFFTPRERARAFARGAFPRRRVRLVAVRGAAECAALFRSELVDAALVDVGAATDETWQVAALAREFPSAPFFAVSPLRPGDGPAAARCAALDFADVLVEGVDDGVARELVARRAFSTRFARALERPPAELGLTTEIQRATWRCVVAGAGRPVRTETLAQAVGVSREHLSRSFAAGGAPNLTRVIDLVRLIACAELAKNPGHDVRDIARVLGFA